MIKSFNAQVPVIASWIL